MVEEKNPHPQVQIANVKLEPFEKAVYAHDYEKAGALLLDMLRKIRVGAHFIGYTNTSDMMMQLHTRFASAIFALLADPDFLLSPEGFSHLASEHSTFDLVFRASVYQTSDHMLPQIADVADVDKPQELSFSDPLKLVKFLLTYSMASPFGMRFEKTFTQSPQISFSIYAGMLSHLLSIDQTAHDRKKELLELAEVFDGKVKLDDSMLPILSDAYMYCSYGDTADRHKIKGVVHRLCADMMRDHEFKTPSFPKERRLKKRPRIVIPIDWYTSLHAMYRCWRPAIIQLRERFELVAISQASAVDEVSKKDFDAWYEVPPENIVLRNIAQQIVDLKPDIVYYPSIGMSLWWMTCASLRLAPIQVMTLGHPASSQSPEIDYVIGDAGTFNDPDLFSERIIELPEGSLFNFTMRPDAEFPVLREPDSDPKIVRIAVPAMLCKLNARFMAVMQRIKQNASLPIEFHYFPNMIGLTLHQTGKEIRRWTPDAFIYERLTYNQYLIYMNQCDISLCTFPFGGTNSNIDSMKMGLPLVCMEGEEPFERFDAIMLRKIGWPEWAIAHTDDEYYEAVMRMIEDQPMRWALREKLLATDLDKAFFTPCADNNFLKAFDHIYTEHEDMQLSKERVVKL